MKFTIRAPATSANLGPGFDALGLALDLWNETRFEILPDAGLQDIEVTGFGAGRLPGGRTNLVLETFNQAFSRAGKVAPGVHASARNGIPVGSGLGSSAAAVVTGLLAANACLGDTLSEADLLMSAAAIEGHPDNVAAALFGGLTVSAAGDGEVLVERMTPHPGWIAAVVLPALSVSTRSMRAALPDMLPRSDAVFNIARAMLVVRALEQGREDLLVSAMTDRVHQPYRLPLIRGGADALAAAKESGVAAAISGAGPGLIALSLRPDRCAAAADAMSASFESCGVDVWRWSGRVSASGAGVVQ